MTQQEIKALKGLDRKVALAEYKQWREEQRKLSRRKWKSAQTKYYKHWKKAREEEKDESKTNKCF